MARDFAPDYARDEENRVLFPRDTDLRALLFPLTDSTKHVAKANMHMVKTLVEYVSQPGELILDPFAGTGTILVAITICRKVAMIELEEHFCNTIGQNMEGLKSSYPDVNDFATLIPGNAMNILPLINFCDHLIFSPPYPMGLKKKGQMDKTSVDLGYSEAADYSSSPENFTNLNDFMYHQRIELFYKKCFQTLKAGGTMTVIIKDRMINGQRIRQADRTERDCLKIGFKLLQRNKWLALGGGYSAINRAAGLETVDEEDLITFVKGATK